MHIGALYIRAANRCALASFFRTVKALGGDAFAAVEMATAILSLSPSQCMRSSRLGSGLKC